MLTKSFWGFVYLTFFFWCYWGLNSHAKKVLYHLSPPIFFCSTGFELKSYTLSHSTSPFLVTVFFQDRVSLTICLGLASTCSSTDLCLLSS
jgi:hypothetical protein